MALPSLPKRTADAWDLRAAFEKTSPIFDVCAHKGRVFVGGGHLYLLGAGAEQWVYRERPDDVGMVWKVAQEQRTPFRRAVATEEGVAIFMGNKPGDRIAHITPPEDDPALVTDLAWGRVGKQAVLWVLWDNGVVARMFPDTGEDDTPDLPPMVALTSDDEGTVAMICWEKHQAYTTRDGISLAYRSLDFTQAWYDTLPETFDDPIHVAVAGSAVAFSIGWRGAFLTRDVASKPFELCAPLGPSGALAFEGSAPDAALFGAPHTEGSTSIVRVDAAGNAMTIGELVVEPGPAVPFDELAWDASRRRLFAVHRQVGLVVATAPDAKGGKRPAAN